MLLCTINVQKNQHVMIFLKYRVLLKQHIANKYLRNAMQRCVN